MGLLVRPPNNLENSYLGTCDQFDEALGKFAVEYADQVEKDYAELKSAVKSGRISIHQDQ
jgi:hypothetical protein